MARVYASLYERLIANTGEPESSTGCWPWLRQCDRWGYGRFTLRVDGQHVKLMAHVALWVLLEAQPETLEEFYFAYLMLTASGLELDHECETPNCCNPDHHDLVTGKVNCQRRNARRLGVSTYA